MKTQPVTVIDGQLPPDLWESSDIEPVLETAPEHLAVLNELMTREPLFHRPEFGTRREDFEKMTSQTFWEVGASGVASVVSSSWIRWKRDTKIPLKTFGK